MKKGPLEINLKHLIENLFDPLVIFDKGRKIVFANKSFLDLVGYSDFQELEGKLIENLILEEEGGRFSGVIGEIFQGKKIRDFHTAIVTKKGREIPVDFSGSGLKGAGGKIRFIFATFVDARQLRGLLESLALTKSHLEKTVKERTKELEERKNELEKAKIALTNILEDVEGSREKAEEEKNKTLAIITNFVDGLLVFDRENRLSLINPQAEDIFGIKSEKVLGQSVPELAKIPNLRSLADLLGKEIKGVFRKELLLRENLILEASTVPIIREEEKLGTLVISHDITREKMVERMKTEFVSLAAHQLRTPLSAVKWTLRMLLDGDLGKITEEQKDFLEKTYSSNERMITLINDLLDITRIEEGRLLYKPVLTDIESIVQFVVGSYNEEIKKRKLKFEFKKPEKKLPQISMDVEKMRLAVQNLLDNAIKYTPSGGEITISLNLVHQGIEFSIKDTGAGIPKDQQARIFTKFFRGANIVRMETGGSGLGLYITKNIIEAHGGKIWFESEEGQGATFYFTLPVKEKFAQFLKEF